MTTQITVGKDNQSTPLWTTDRDPTAQSILLPADTIKTVTVPSNATYAVFRYSSPICYVNTTTFDLPGSSFQNVGAELTPSAWNVTPGDTLYFKSRTQIELSVSFYN